MKIVIDHEVVGFPGYWVRQDGTVIGKYGRPLKPQIADKYGHRSVTLCKGKKCFPRYVHNLVADAFVENPRPDIFNFNDHIDRTLNNHYLNLRYVDNQLNQLNTKSKYRKRRVGSSKYRASCRFFNKQYHLGMYKTEAEALAIQDRVRAALFEKLYNWHTRPVTGCLPPETWNPKFLLDYGTVI